MPIRTTSQLDLPVDASASEELLRKGQLDAHTTNGRIHIPNPSGALIDNLLLSQGENPPIFGDVETFCYREIGGGVIGGGHGLMILADVPIGYELGSKNLIFPSSVVLNTTNTILYTMQNQLIECDYGSIVVQKSVIPADTTIYELRTSSGVTFVNFMADTTHMIPTCTLPLVLGNVVSNNSNSSSTRLTRLTVVADYPIVDVSPSGVATLYAGKFLPNVSLGEDLSGATLMMPVWFAPESDTTSFSSFRLDFSSGAYLEIASANSSLMYYRFTPNGTSNFTNMIDTYNAWSDALLTLPSNVGTITQKSVPVMYSNCAAQTIVIS